MSDIKELKVEAARAEHRSNQQIDWFRPEDDSEILVERRWRAGVPARAKRPSCLDGFKPYLEQRLRAGVWNARVLLRELRERGYAGSYTIPTDWLSPQRQAAGAVRRLETAPGEHYGEPGVIVRTRRSAFGLAAGTHRPVLGANITRSQRFEPLDQAWGRASAGCVRCGPVANSRALRFMLRSVRT